MQSTAKPDVQGSACTINCKTEPKVASLLPDHARDAHGNLAEQSRTLGGSRGANTLKSENSESNRPIAFVNPA